MKISEQWLRTWVNPDVTTAQLAQQITNAGLEVDSVTPVAGQFSQVLIGQVLMTKPHPSADKLTLCDVGIGATESLSIVCGAANVLVGARVAVATVGAQLPNGMEIKPTKLRGQESMGMLCSARELGLEENGEGILLLPDDAPIGIDIREYMLLDDQIIDIDLTPNRGDCFSIAGVAREVAALNELAYTPSPIEPIPAMIDDKLAVKVDDYAACGQYIGRIIRDLNRDAITPLWMLERLRRSGIRAIHPVVDIANYVMLEMGQPLHAFDLEKLQGGICVRQAREGEQLELLDGQTVGLKTNTLVIADDNQVLAMAGIMGGLQSAVSDETVNIFLESAYFPPKALAGMARSYNVVTDSSHRFERGVDPKLQRQAAERATQLIQEILGGQVGPIICVNDAAHLPIERVVVLRASVLENLLGFRIEQNTVARILESLGMPVDAKEDSWHVTVPTSRFDIAIEADLVEEVGRIYGYDKIPTQSLLANIKGHPPQIETQLSRTQIGQTLVNRGYYEIISYSFIDPVWQQALDSEHTPLVLANPISPELSVMRTSLWPGLLRTVQYNQCRQLTDMRLFETGLVFLNDKNDTQQLPRIAGVITGDMRAGTWNLAKQPVDFYDMKADVEALLELTGSMTDFDFVIKPSHPSLHPGKSARILRGEKPVGWVGEIHPGLAQQLDLEMPIVMFELDYTLLKPVHLPSFTQLSKFPTVRRDLSFLINEKINAQDILQCVQQQADGLLRDVKIFDVYKGDEIPAQQKSIAIAMFLQHQERNLLDEEIQTFVMSVVKALEAQYAIEMR